MCGRCAISRRSLTEAEDLLGADCSTSQGREPPRDDNRASRSRERRGHSFDQLDNPNMSPGMRGFVFRKRSTHAENQASGIVCTDMVWGLAPRGGTKTSPLATGPTQHFSNLMFNARSDTLYDKRTFRELALKGNTCVVAVDGFYEWKAPDKDVLGGGSGKQPYYVHRSDGLPLLIAGLWTAVPTGRECGYDAKPEMLHTFTLLTTDACPKLRWLHSRMPVFICDPTLALEWIQTPNQELEKKIAHTATTANQEPLAWHPVTKRMSKAQYRGEDCTRPIKIDKAPSVKAFFSQPYAVKKVVDSKVRVPEETGPTHLLAEGWRDEVKSEMERKRPASFSPAKSPVKKTKATTPASSPTMSSTKGGNRKTSPARRGQITSFFSAKGSSSGNG